MDKHQIGELPLPIEVIFSCTVCQATISDIYGSKRTEKLDKAIGTDHGIRLPRLWLTECCHLTCSKHLDGGGVPFHAANDIPCATCPVCSVEYGDMRKKQLFGIEKRLEGSFHPNIPMTWFETPPMELEGNTEGLSALRFHYISLIRFATHLLPKYREMAVVLEKLEAEGAKHIAKQRDLEMKLKTLRIRAAELEHCERELKPWQDREHKIKHYLDIFTEIMGENKKLRNQLRVLGYAIPRKEYETDDHAHSPSRKGMHQQISVSLDPNEEHRENTNHFMSNLYYKQLVSRNRPASTRAMSSSGRSITNEYFNTLPRRTGYKRTCTEDGNSQDRKRKKTRILYNNPIDFAIQPSDHVEGTSVTKTPIQKISTVAQGRSQNAIARKLDTSRALLKPTNLIDANPVRDKGNTAPSLGKTTSIHEHPPYHINHSMYRGSTHHHVPDHAINTVLYEGEFNLRNRNEASPGHKLQQHANSSNVQRPWLSNRIDRVHGEQHSNGQSQLQSSSSSRNMLHQDFVVPVPKVFAIQHRNFTARKQWFSSPIPRQQSFLRTPWTRAAPFTPYNESVASPFFIKGSKFERNGRLTLPSRTDVKQDWSEPPCSRSYKDSGMVEHPSHMAPFPRSDQYESLLQPRFRPPFEAKTDMIASTPRIQSHDTLLGPPATSLRSKLFHIDTTRSANGLFQRTDITQSPSANDASTKILAHSPLFGGSLPTCPSDNAALRTWHIHRNLADNPSVVHLDNRATEGTISPVHALDLGSTTSHHYRAAESYLSKDLGHDGARWHGMRASRSGVLRLSGELDCDHDVQQQPSSRRRVRR